MALAADQGRILVSHDNRTMPQALAKFVASGGTSPGLILVIPQHAPIREVADALVLIWMDDRPEDWRDSVVRIPF